VSEPGTTNFLHYSGHGGQVQDPTGNHPSGVLDTICPVDFQDNGQIDSDMLHQKLVKALPSNSSLFVILDCCHSGSALELPLVYRGDADGNVNLVDNIKQGVHLLSEANSLIQGGSFNMDEAQDLYAGATSFFRSFKHMGDQKQSGLGEDGNYSENAGEQKMVTMFSGCRDDQTSADANIQGTSEGAMSWAFLETMKRIPNPSYIEVRDSYVLFMKTEI
jgi:metacaspase-1